jgi:hypothetical protein
MGLLLHASRYRLVIGGAQRALFPGLVRDV